MTEARIVTQRRRAACASSTTVGVLAPADVHVARRLAALAGETD